MNKKYQFLLLAVALCLQSFMVGDDTMTKENGVYVINTTEIGRDIEGYQATTPLKVYIKKDKVEKIEFLKSQETPKYYVKVKKALLNKWDGKKVKDAKTQNVDAVTRSYLFLRSRRENVRLALDYYQNHK